MTVDGRTHNFKNSGLAYHEYISEIRDILVKLENLGCVLEAAEAHLAAEDVMLGLISVGGFGKRDAAVVAKWVESCGALEDALAALRHRPYGR